METGFQKRNYKMKSFSKCASAMVAIVLLAGMASAADTISSGKVKAVHSDKQEFVLTDANGAYVFQVSGGKAHRVNVTSGEESQGMVAISGGTDPHLPVVVLGNYELQEGMQVRQGP